MFVSFFKGRLGENPTAWYRNAADRSRWKDLEKDFLDFAGTT
jgi:hypothetical protein